MASAGTHASDTRSVSARDAPGGSESATLKASSRNGGKKLDPKSFATHTAPAVRSAAARTTVFGSFSATQRNGR